MTKPRTKKNPTSSPAKTIDAGLQVEPPKGSGPSLPAVALPVPLAQGVAELVRLTGLEEAAVVRHLLSSALFWAGLNPHGEFSFAFLLDATMGEDGAAEFKKQALNDACAFDLEAVKHIGSRRGAEIRAAFPGDWPAEV